MLDGSQLVRLGEGNEHRHACGPERARARSAHCAGGRLRWRAPAAQWDGRGMLRACGVAGCGDDSFDALVRVLLQVIGEHGRLVGEARALQPRALQPRAAQGRAAGSGAAGSAAAAAAEVEVAEVHAGQAVPWRCHAGHGARSGRHESAQGGEAATLKCTVRYIPHLFYHDVHAYFI